VSKEVSGFWIKPREEINDEVRPHYVASRFSFITVPYTWRRICKRGSRGAASLDLHFLRIYYQKNSSRP
jgi:hypothetical protein